MAIQSKAAYLALAESLAEGQEAYGAECILKQLPLDHPNPAVTSAKFEWVKKTAGATTNYDEVCIKLNTGEVRSALGLNKCDAAAQAASDFA